ncbi:MAG: hypothetical protein WDZ94_03155 [Patescibacteria group bacterium]
MMRLPESDNRPLVESKLPRRTFLKGTGAALAGMFLPAFSGVASGQSRDTLKLPPEKMTEHQKIDQYLEETYHDAWVHHLVMHSGPTFKRPYDTFDEFMTALKTWDDGKEGVHLLWRYYRLFATRIPILYCKPGTPPPPAMIRNYYHGGKFVQVGLQYERYNFSVGGYELDPVYNLDELEVSSAGTPDTKSVESKSVGDFEEPSDEVIDTSRIASGDETPGEVTPNIHELIAQIDQDLYKEPVFDKIIHGLVEKQGDWTNLVRIVLTDGLYHGTDIPYKGTMIRASDEGGYPNARHLLKTVCSIQELIGENRKPGSIIQMPLYVLEGYTQEDENFNDGKLNIISAAYQVEIIADLINGILHNNETGSSNTIVVAAILNVEGHVEDVSEKELDPRCIICCSIEMDEAGNPYIPYYRGRVKGHDDNVFFNTDSSGALSPIPILKRGDDGSVSLHFEYKIVRISGSSFATSTMTTYLAAIASRLNQLGKNHEPLAVIEQLKKLCNYTVLHGRDSQGHQSDTTQAGYLPDPDKFREFFGDSDDEPEGEPEEPVEPMPNEPQIYVPQVHKD